MNLVEAIKEYNKTHKTELYFSTVAKVLRVSPSEMYMMSLQKKGKWVLKRKELLDKHFPELSKMLTFDKKITTKKSKEKDVIILKREDREKIKEYPYIAGVKLVENIDKIAFITRNKYKKIMEEIKEEEKRIDEIKRNN